MTQDNPERFGTPTQRPLRRIAALALPEWRWLALGSVFLVIGGAMALSYPQAIRIIIDGAGQEGGRDLVDKAALAMGIIFAVQAVAVALRYYLFTVTGERIVARLRQKLYRAVIEQEIGFFDARPTGELLNRLSSDTTVLSSPSSSGASNVSRRLGVPRTGLSTDSPPSPEESSNLSRADRERSSRTCPS